MGEGHERGDGKRNRSAQTCGEKAWLKAKKNRPARGRLGKAFGVERRIGRHGFFEFLETRPDFFRLLACKITLPVFAAVRPRMFAVCAVVVVRMARNAPMASRQRVRIAFCIYPDWHDAHSFGFNTARSTWEYRTILFLYYTISEVN